MESNSTTRYDNDADDDDDVGDDHDGEDDDCDGDKDCQMLCGEQEYNKV